jgi:hypothetical protein
MKITSVKKVNEPLKVYDFTVDDVHHYILDNGIISHNSYIPTKEMSGGSGLKYVSSTVVYLSKKKEKDGTEVIGNIVKARMHKSRFTQENKEVQVLVSHTKGLDRYYGLLDLAEKYDIFKKVSTRYELPDGSKVFGKQIMKEPTKYFTDDILKQLDDAARKEYMYGNEIKEELNEATDE